MGGSKGRAASSVRRRWNRSPTASVVAVDGDRTVLSTRRRLAAGATLTGGAGHRIRPTAGEWTTGRLRRSPRAALGAPTRPEKRALSGAPERLRTRGQCVPYEPPRPQRQPPRNRRRAIRAHRATPAEPKPADRAHEPAPTEHAHRAGPAEPADRARASARAAYAFPRRVRPIGVDGLHVAPTSVTTRSATPSGRVPRRRRRTRHRQSSHIASAAVPRVGALPLRRLADAISEESPCPESSRRRHRESPDRRSVEFAAVSTGRASALTGYFRTAGSTGSPPRQPSLTASTGRSRRAAQRQDAVRMTGRSGSPPGQPARGARPAHP